MRSDRQVTAVGLPVFVVTAGNLKKGEDQWQTNK
ncbi:hypothetical protein SAMN06296020_10481 [Anoxynatronum buryatiense]|uniref:Uncharacterized protein n=1 Tax=Anoxynatronum buryatiense TaxID=489973 RepID=A0AA45WV56_9CLOT|nr:hypothetical protein SAMN06296020_10481 [Anoxynatronum buryatiense]